MSTAATVIIVEIPVVTTVAAGVVAWFVRRIFKVTDELEAGQVVQAVTIANLTATVTAQGVTVASHDRRLPTLAENLAVLAAFVERHERWHERHDGGSHPNPPG